MKVSLYRIFGLLLLFTQASCAGKIQKFFLNEAVVRQSEMPSPENPCTRFMNYAPDERYPYHTPMRHIRVNFHIINSEDSTLNFNLKDGIEYVYKLIEQANHTIANNQKMSLPEGNNTPVLPMKYRYVITPDTDDPDDKGVYVHYDNELAYFNKQGTNKTTFDKQLFEKYGTRKGETLNIFMLEHHPDSAKSPTYKSSVDGVGFSDWVKMVGAFQHLYHKETRDDGTVHVTGPYYRIGILNHEIGHTLGLNHTWNSNDGCDDTPMNPGCWDHLSEKCRATGIYSNNMMDYNNCQCALTPCQIAKVQYNFSREGSSQRKLLAPNWCDYKKDSSIIIGFGDKGEWKCAKDLEGDIIINNGGELTIRCETSLPKGAKIIVKPRGALILNGATITNKCGDRWEGIEIWRSEKKEGQVIFLNNAKIENAKHPVIAINEPGEKL